VVHLLWESNAQHAGMEDTMKRKRHTPEQIVRKLREGDRLLNEGTDLTEVLRHLETATDPRSLTTTFHKLCEAAGIGRRRFHALRHTFATLSLSGGTPLEVISTVLGHASYAVTSDIYAQVHPAAKSTASEAVANQLHSSGPA
jgi:integrase